MSAFIRCRLSVALLSPRKAPSQRVGAALSASSSARCSRPLCARRLSTKANVTPSAADRRLAGRQRFYKHVGIASTAPPDDKNRHSINGSTSDDRSVRSPISAGVDGTQSATGVTTTIDDASSWSSLLNPHNKSPPAGWHTVTLDGRPLRTPLGLPLTLPSIPLALAVASEWDAQQKFLRPAQMPLMTLCCTAIDQVASNPNPHRQDVMRYLRNDTSCYWADPREDRVLHRRQSQAWEGLHTTLSLRLLGLSDDLGPAQAVGGDEALMLSRRSEGNPVSGLPHPPILVEKAKNFVDSLDAWNLAALYSACAESKSFFIGAALIHEAAERVRGNESMRDAKWAVLASRVEEEFNIEAWGLVEGGHDYDRLNASIQMHSAAFLAQAVAHSVRED
ncbi:hypothetical protein HJC23_005645 [Cyclotella cryptica]|uniref:ATP synthase mitochondrial F1 complex assembly factor 2 n=1 Tax=Cyclotella cryptica TaxID=29204 RepID=A0ABD3PYY5_9STRA|eukprot:CCRYP_010510-RA/>CCRYP_010510-RA protein AED:0.45 eAED:0.45 QI:0/-1/0/1/-1/1/1/0/391